MGKISTCGTYCCYHFNSIPKFMTDKFVLESADFYRGQDPGVLNLSKSTKINKHTKVTECNHQHGGVLPDHNIRGSIESCSGMA